MSFPEEDRTRKHPGDRFSKRILEQNLDQLSNKLKGEEFGDGHRERGHNQIELYRHGNTTVSLFVLDEGAHLPEHSVDDGSVMVQVLEGKLCFQTEDAEDHLHPETSDVIVVEPGVAHSVQAEERSRMLITIMRD